jgi:hypothetical protein
MRQSDVGYVQAATVELATTDSHEKLASRG